jgi:hypothetical protein
MPESSLIPADRVQRHILLLRGQKVLLDFQLAELYGVATKVLNQAVKRNLERFPGDFMFQLSVKEAQEALRSQLVSMDDENWSPIVTGAGSTHSQSAETPTANRSQSVTGTQRHRDPQFSPYAFTEQGVAMLSSVLRSPRAIQVNIAIMRTFVELRRWLSSHEELSRKLEALERKYDVQFKSVFDAIRELMERTEPARKPKREIGFHTLLISDKHLKSKSRSRKTSP